MSVSVVRTVSARGLDVVATLMGASSSGTGVDTAMAHATLPTRRHVIDYADQPTRGA
jgi:hypothetical protein